MAPGILHNKTPEIGVGFRYSPYGMAYNPGEAYWAKLGNDIAGRLTHTVPEVIWIVSVLEGQGTHLTFPATAVNIPDNDITFSRVDENQSALDLFDRHGFRVWLQLEPGNAQVETLINLILARYVHHPSVVGIGVDVEWHHSTEIPEGTPVGDDEAAAWLAAARKHNRRYRLFLKHWEVSMLPPSLRDGLFFVDDSQMFNSLDEMLLEFKEWGRHFYPAPVGYQIGYPTDKKWWGECTDPPKEIGSAILASIPNAKGIYWVNFSATDVFPP